VLFVNPDIFHRWGINSRAGESPAAATAAEEPQTWSSLGAFPESPRLSD